jgi:hypothetical protein
MSLEYIITHVEKGRYAEIGVCASEDLVRETVMPFISDEINAFEDILMNHDF